MEDARVDLYFLDAGAVELLQGCYNSGFLPCAGGAVDEEMREVAALGLELVSFGGRGKEGTGRTRDRRRSERSLW